MLKLHKSNIFLFLLDLFFSISASVIAILLVRYNTAAIPNFSHYIKIYLLSALVVSAVGGLVSKSYRIVYEYASFKAVGNLLSFTIIKIAILLMPVLFDLDFVMPKSDRLLMLDFLFTLLFLLGHRYIIASYKEVASEVKMEDNLSNVSKLNVVIYGTTSKSVSVVTRYENSKNYNVIGFVSRDKAMIGKIIMGRPVIGIPNNLNDFHIKDAEAILFATHKELMAEKILIDFCETRGICVLSIPTTDVTNYPGFQISEIKHMLENQFVPDHMGGIERSTKRLIDLFVSAILIVIFSPLMLVIGLVLLFKDGKPVFFKQERIGRFGRPFNILKFRTMRIDAEASGPALYSGENDPRMTKVGRFLRQHHLDELPQLFNVFLGQMSFVGYRPERKVFIDKIVEHDARYAYLYQIRPGVTSYATLKNGYTDTLEKMLKRLQYDLYYLNHRSILFDIKILWMTFLSIAVGKKF